MPHPGVGLGYRHNRPGLQGVGVGFEDGDIAELLDGVEEGASLVVVGNQALRDAARVRLPEDPTLEPKKEDEPALPGTGDAAAAAAAEAG